MKVIWKPALLFGGVGFELTRASRFLAYGSHRESIKGFYYILLYFIHMQ